ncbi:FAD synthase-like [Babylonia areolata]|uniref:FAD synthase-like n=1 Tax=Babylonia areolata TaxID=304850 RepID=UPI003FD37E62
MHTTRTTAHRLLQLRLGTSTALKPGFTIRQQGSMDMKNGVTAGIIIVGDEILKGHTQDTNSHFLCKRLFALGVQVKRISVIGDDLEAISKEVRDFSGQFTHVITSGGVGPTHDDMTFEGVAKAFSLPISPHPQMVQLIKDHFGPDNLDSAKLKMAEIPATSTLHYGVHRTTGEKNKYPVVSVRNVFMFPGVPSLFETGFECLEGKFRNPNVTFHTQELYINVNETTIASDIQRVADRFNKTVVIGSYPDFHNSYYKVKISFESTQEDQVSDACSQLQQCLPNDTVVAFEKDPIRTAAQHVYQIVNADIDDLFHNSVRHAVSVIEEALEKYSLNEICIGFNGGKDCTVLLHLFHAVVQQKYPKEEVKLQALYIRSRLPFPEVELFVQQACSRYHLELIRYEGRIKENLASLKQGHPDVKAVLMGTRTTDPYSGHLQSFSMTDSDWPQLMRVNPILSWTYETVWRFLRTLCLPYCSLYDQGYTSLGSMNNTHPNPSLQVIDSHGIVSYKPAYLLMENGKERDGRNV